METPNDQIIEQRRKIIEEKRKKVVRNNLFLSLSFIFVIIGLIGSIYSYNELNKLNRRLKDSEKREMVVNDSLIQTTNALEYSKDSLREAKAELASEKSRSDSFLLEVNGLLRKFSGSQTSKSTTTFVNKIAASRDVAREFARDGYSKLKIHDFPGAMAAFNKSEKASNGYLDSYDVWFLLWKDRKDLDKLTTQQKLFEKIIKDYNSLQILTETDKP